MAVVEFGAQALLDRNLQVSAGGGGAEGWKLRFFSENYINPDSIPIGTKRFGTFVPARQFRLKNQD